jgi:large subunit ribosomal protein L10
MRKEKQFLLDEIKDKLGASSALFVTRYNKLEPNAAWQLRDKLGKQGTVYEVVRKRVFLKALEGTEMKLDPAMLEGHIGIAFVTKDAMASAKTLFQFGEENPDTLTVLCGQMDGKLLPGAEVEALSKLPSLDEMRAILLGLFTSPMAQFLSVLEAKAKQETES